MKEKISFNSPLKKPLKLKIANKVKKTTSNIEKVRIFLSKVFKLEIFPSDIYFLE